VQIFAHRGSSARAPENTLAALRLAIADGADGAEIDVQVTRDNEVVLVHDDDLLRTAGDPRPTCGCSAEAVAALDAGSWFGPAFKGERIPTLAEALETVRDRLRLNIELKPAPGRLDLADRVAAILKEAGAPGRWIVSSFDAAVLQRFRDVRPTVPSGRILAGDSAGLDPTDAGFVSVEHPAIDAGLVQAATARGIEVHAWTVNDPRRALELEALGVACVMTDDPAALRAGMEKGRA
jgi:glycerophosphoryl diester phosphodiesterase